ncbi:MAG: CotH kinase family protein [Bacteroidales bacterium]
MTLHLVDDFSDDPSDQPSLTAAMPLWRMLLTMLLFLLCFSLQGQVIFSEIMASNATVFADPDQGEYVDWVEIYNAGSSMVDLSGWFLSDDPGDPVQWAFPQGTQMAPYSYLLIYADGTGLGIHTSFKLSKDGETIILANASRTVVDSMAFPVQLTDISYGRSRTDPSTYGYFEHPTPGFVNGPDISAGIADPPQFSLESGFYTGARSITLTSSTPSAEIRYTLDGTEPTAASPLYAAPLQIDSTSVVRARSYAAEMLTAPAVTHSFFIDEPQNLPVVSLVTDPNHFFSDATGIYVIGTAGVAGYCTEVPHNVNMDWERPVNIELIEKDGTVGLNQQAGVKIFGGCSRVRYPIKSLALFARKEYETSSFDYQLFPDKPNDEYESFILRAGADDQPFTMIRDPLTATVVEDVIDVDVQAHRPVVVYINGAYWGIHNLREKINEDYLENNYGVDPDSVDLLASNPEDSWNTIAGSPDNYNAMIDFLRNNDITQDANYAHIQTQMEVDEYINYQIIQIFFGGRDWPGNNIKFWRMPTGPHHRWRWILYDMDHMFKEYFSDIMEEATEVDCGCVWPNPPWSTYLFRRLLENESFRNEFIQRFAYYSSTYFSRERLHGIIDEMEAELLPELPRHIERWGGQVTSLPDNTWVTPIFESVEQWKENMQVIRDFVDSRHELALQHVNEYFGIEGVAGLELTLEPSGTGTIRSGGTLVPSLPFSGTFSEGETLTLSTLENPGYIFSHWETTTYPMVDTVLISRGDTWKYLVTRTIPDDSWREVAYDDSLWSEDKAELGYGDGDEQTVIDYGGDPDYKIITTWFRKKITLEDPGLNRRYTLNLLRDDGARVFVNGVEVIRNNLNRFFVGGYSLAEISQEVPEESSWYSYEINPGLFTPGDNIVAVEVHQASVTSSDLSFDLELVAHRRGSSDTLTSETEEMELEMRGDAVVRAVLVADTNQIGQIYINEIMASNVDGLADEAGEYEDWIELYNAGPDEVNLAGLYLSDSYPAVNPWSFPVDQPGETLLSSEGYMVVFADGEPADGPLHTDFKLSKDGEEVVLLQKIGEEMHVIDRLIFGIQARNKTFGRYPDGSSILEYLGSPTPRASNVLTSVDTPVPLPADSDPEVTLYPVPTNGPLYIRFNRPDPEASRILISVYSISGTMVTRAEYDHSQLIRVSLEDQPAGMYLVHIRKGEDLYVRRVILQ